AVQVMRDGSTFTVDDPRFSTAQVVGPSMLSLDGAAHARHRDPFEHPFGLARTRERFTAYVEEQVDELVGAPGPGGGPRRTSRSGGPSWSARSGPATAPSCGGRWPVRCRWPSWPRRSDCR